jgi:glutathione S-transferase
MSGFLLHTIPGSPFGRAALVALEEKGSPYRILPVRPGTLRSAAHLSLHPFGRVPVLVHGEFRLYETAAILRYLDRVLPSPPLTPPEPRAAARMDQLMSVNDWYLFPGAGNVIGFQRIVGPRILGLTPDAQAIAAALPRAHAAIAELGRSLGGHPYLAGDAFTLADALIGPQLAFLAETPEWDDLRAQAPNLDAWLARVTARASFRATTWERVAAMAQAA